MTLTAITIEGGHFAPELIEDIAAHPDQVDGQRPLDFGLAASTKLSDEIQNAFSVAQVLWAKFESRRAAANDASTTITRSAWALPFLQNALDFPQLQFQRAAPVVGGQSFPISHLLGDAAGATPVHIVAFERELDDRGSDRWSPHSLVQEYLNRSDALWGLVTNGRQLRLLRDTTRITRPTYLEADLDGIVAGGLYAEFAVLWRLLHRTRFPTDAGDAPTCRLERWYQEGIEAGGRVRAQLGVGVEQALELFGQGFVEHAANDALRDALAAGRLTEAGFYRQLLRLIYRLLFLMVAEERRLVQLDGPEHASHQQLYAAWYGVGRLRDRAERRRGEDRHVDLWCGLTQTFHLFRDGDAALALGLGVLDGELFGLDACPDLEPSQLCNDTLLKAIWALSTFEEKGKTGKRQGRRRVSYAALDVEELGSVYEGLLELHPKADTQLRTFGFVKGSERKSTGSYYTPKALVAELIKSALEPVLAERLAAAITAEDKARAILAIRICDPAAGSGHFLLAAARRLGRELAIVRSGEAEPTPTAYRRAVRDVVRHCLYAVDRNPLAVDLCKVALWLESQAPGVPLSFLDHRVRCGDALIGVFDLDVLKEDIPDEAFKALTGDNKEIAKALAKRNKSERKASLFQARAAEDLKGFAAALAALDAIDEPDPAGVAAKAECFRALHDDPAWVRWKTACDLWCAAFYAPKTETWAKRVPTTDHVWRALADPAHLPPELRAHAVSLAEDRAVLHWPLEFPEVMTAGGFDVLLGNPPWERIKLQEQEFFAARDPDIANAPNQAARHRKIAALAGAPAGSPQRDLHAAFELAKRFAEADSQFVRTSDRFPLTAVGDINTYALFAEHFVRAISSIGRAGVVVPTGIATADQTKAFFRSILDGQRLVSFLNFTEIRDIFVATDDRSPFGILTIGQPEQPPAFAFSCPSVDEVGDPRRRFTLSPDDIALLNPNTRTCPIFRTSQDAELTKKVYRRVPVLIDEAKVDAGNPWGISFLRMFDMSNDSGLFYTREKLADRGAELCGNVFVLPDEEPKKCPDHLPAGERWLPLYEARMIHHFDHRWFSYAGGRTDDEEEGGEGTGPHAPDAIALPHYWVEERLVEERLASRGWTHDWLMGWRDICRSTDERTVIASVVPRAAVGNKLPLLLLGGEIPAILAAALVGNLSCLVLDYNARQKVGGTTLNFFLAKQFPLLSPANLDGADLEFIKRRMLELTYTAYDLSAWARDLGHHGPPFAWNPDHRALLRAELDAYYAWLYGLTRDELRYMLDPKEVMGEDFPSETFRVLKENEIRRLGEYRTRRLVLAAWDGFVADGTFDPERDGGLTEHEQTKARLARTQRELALAQGLVSDALARPKPVLFVEGVSDVPIVEAAWAAFHPGEALPVDIVPAGGVEQMKSLAGKGKALRHVIGNRLLLALADNDGAGRELLKGTKVKPDGQFVELENGIRWASLPASPEFEAVMKRLSIPPEKRPCTVEQMFTAALRREAGAADAYATGNKLFDDLLTGLATKTTDPLWDLGPEDDAHWYVRAPRSDKKEAFAAWITAPERRTPEVYTAFRPLVDGIAALAGAAQ